MINLRNSPFLWFALMLLLAFSTTGHFSLTGSPIGTLIPALLCFMACVLGLMKYQPGRQIWSTIALAVLIFNAGAIRLGQFESITIPGDPQPQSLQMHGLIEVTEILKEKDNGLSLRCKNINLKSTRTDTSIFYGDKFIVVQIRDPELSNMLPGDRLWVKGWVSTIKGPSNPHAFDIRKYYRSIGIRHQITCKGNEVAMHNGTHHTLFRLTAKWQSSLCEIIREHTSPQVAQLTNALVWGDRTDMDEDIRNAFANSGAMHVLSVSGMHMAMVYSMLFLVLGAPGSGTFPRRMIRLCMYTLAIIFYMGLTGACPAIVRSGLMIILFLVGKAMGWNTQIWNLLGFAAFLMLWINPFVMYSIGFQLSFLAMAGILLYAKPMIRFYAFKYIILHRVWEVTAVSLAAQVFIFPLLLYQFYQFPLTFVASSLVAMPASYIVIFGSLLNICLSFLEWPWLWEIFDIACRYFIVSMKWMAGLNPNMNYSLPVIAGFLLTGMAILFSVALVYRWPRGKRLAYLLGVIAFINLAWHRTVEWNKDELVIYHQYQGLLMDVIINGHCISIQDSLVTKRSIDFAARGNRCFKDVITTQSVLKSERVITPSLEYNVTSLELPGYCFLIWSGNSQEEINTTSVTHLLMDQDKDLNGLKDFICRKPDILIILPAHLNRFSKNTLIKFLKENNTLYHDISEQGYFSLPL